MASLPTNQIGRYLNYLQNRASAHASPYTWLQQVPGKTKIMLIQNCVQPSPSVQNEEQQQCRVFPISPEYPRVKSIRMQAWIAIKHSV